MTTISTSTRKWIEARNKATDVSRAAFRSVRINALLTLYEFLRESEGWHGIEECRHVLYGERHHYLSQAHGSQMRNVRRTLYTLRASGWIEIEVRSNKATWAQAIAKKARME